MGSLLLLDLPCHDILTLLYEGIPHSDCCEHSIRRQPVAPCKLTILQGQVSAPKRAWGTRGHYAMAFGAFLSFPPLSPAPETIARITKIFVYGCDMRVCGRA